MPKPCVLDVAGRFPYLFTEDNTYQSSTYNLNVGLFVGVNNFDNSLLLVQAVSVTEFLNSTFIICWPLFVWLFLCSFLTPVSRQVTRLKQFSPLPNTSGAKRLLPKMSQKIPKGKIGDEAFQCLAAQISRARR